jgi:hypothetical protein
MFGELEFSHLQLGPVSPVCPHETGFNLALLLLSRCILRHVVLVAARELAGPCSRRTAPPGQGIPRQNERRLDRPDRRRFLGRPTEFRWAGIAVRSE